MGGGEEDRRLFREFLKKKLAEWGYEPGTVKEVIASLLRKEGPQSKDKIIAHVLSSRIVKPNTVALSMHDKNLFYENNDGHVALKEA